MDISMDIAMLHRGATHKVDNLTYEKHENGKIWRYCRAREKFCYLGAVSIVGKSKQSKSIMIKLQPDSLTSVQ